MAERKLVVLQGERAGEIESDETWLPSDVVALANKYKQALREIEALKRERLRKLENDPQTAVVERVLAYWRNTCRGPKSRALVPIDGRRADAVRKAMKWMVDADDDPDLASRDEAKREAALLSASERAAERIRQAIDGAARKPYEAYGRRYAEPGKERQRKDDILFILRDEGKLEQCAAIVEDDDERLAYRADLWRRMQSSPQLVAVMASLSPTHGEITSRAVRWAQAQ